MDSRSFDRLAASIGTATSRRGAIRATLGALIAGIVGIRGVDVDAARRSRLNEVFGPLPEGPCAANPVGNDCRADKNCCTKNCHRGKCRWVRPGGRCSSNRQCKSHLCQNGRCSSSNPGVASGEACTRTTSCADAAAICTGYTFGWPGEFCLLPTGAACLDDGECASGLCTLAGCAETCTVCADGCPHTTIGAAVAAAPEDGVIGVAPGSYDEAVIFEERTILRRCGSRGEVLWTTTDPDAPIITVRPDQLVGINGLTLIGGVDYSTASLVLVEEAVAESWSWTSFLAVNCTFRDYRGAHSAVRMIGKVSYGFEQCTFENLHAEGPGGAIGFETPLANGYGWIGRSTFSGCQAGWDNQGAPTQSGGAIGLGGAEMTIEESTFVGNRAIAGGAIALLADGDLIIRDSLLHNNEATGSNVAAAVGGAILLASFTAPEVISTVTLSGSTRVVDNIASDGGGGIAVQYGFLVGSDLATTTRVPYTPVYHVTGANNRVYRNVANPQCVRSLDGENWTEVVNCAL